MSHYPDTGTGPSPGASPSTSTGLLERVKAQEPEAWERLVELYGPLIYRWCRQAGLQAEDASDLVQEVLSTVVVRLAEFHRGQRRGSFRSWIRAIARNKVGSHFLRLRNHERGEGGTTAQERLQQIAERAAPPSTTNGAREESLLSRRALDLIRSEFEGRTWQAFWRVAIEGRSPTHVAEDLGMSVHAVYKAKSRVFGRLRKEVDHPLD